ncbi:MAG: SAM-dependent methyltransferase [Dokdonella sp.]
MNHALPEPGADERAHSAALAALIRDEIAAQGPMPFSRYMALCLYAPGLGYYSAGRTKFGAAGDFTTAPELGGLFARCVARAVAPTLRELGATADFVELGGGSGAFALDALHELAVLDALPQRYRMLETSADLRARQRARVQRELPQELAARVEWIEQPPELAWNGVLFANEVVDALPVTRFAIHAGEIFEEYVGVDGDRFSRVDRPADGMLTTAVHHLQRSLEAPLADGYRSEVLPQLPHWIAAIATPLRRGLMLFTDYGYPHREFYLPQRRDGTLVCHYRHRAHADPLHWPGLQDITAFVDFSWLAEAGTSIGFDLVGYAPQAQFLLASGLPELLAQADTLPDLERLRLVAEVKRLTLPGDMGERFQAMGFARGVGHVPAALRASAHSRRL